MKETLNIIKNDPWLDHYRSSPVCTEQGSRVDK